VKFLRNFLDKQERHFHQGGKLERWFPLYEAIDTLIYTPGKVTRSGAHVRDALDLKRMMLTVVLALVPATLMALYNTGYQAHSALFELGQTTADGWRGLVMAFIGLPADPGNIIANFCSRCAVLLSRLYRHTGGWRGLGSAFCRCQAA
jgi:Na+-transporting NADH:ubiquinone oxidoreductase subunit B